jgi:hypothetical protein
MASVVENPRTRIRTLRRSLDPSQGIIPGHTIIHKKRSCLAEVVLVASFFTKK